MMRWLVIGGVATLAYLLVTSKDGLHLLQPGNKAKPLPQAPPAQHPAPPATPQASVVPGAGVSILQDAAAAAGIIGSLADAAKKLGIFGSPDTPDTTVAADPTAIQQDPNIGAASPAFGAAFF